MPILRRARLGWVFLLVTVASGAQRPGYQVADIRTEPCPSPGCVYWVAGSHPNGGLVMGAEFAFLANTRAMGNELFLSDGTLQGTRPVLDIQPGPGSSSTLGYPPVLGPGGDLYFVAAQDIIGYRLWRSDGTTSGTRAISAPISVPWGGPSMVMLGGRLLLAAWDDAHGAELWASDGTASGTGILKDIQPGSAGSYPQWLTVAGNYVFFQADDGNRGPELWRTDGTTKGTVLVKDILAGSYGSGPSWLVPFAGRVYFSASDGSHGFELWESNGTALGTRLVEDVSPTTSSTPQGLTVCGERFYFTADDGTHGRELWTSDGSATGTHLVRDIAPTEWPASDIAEMTPLDGILYFSARQVETGSELWRSDGTEPGTYLVRDLLPGEQGGSPGSVSVALGRLFLAVSDGVGGYGLWVSDGTTEGTEPLCMEADVAEGFFEFAGLAYFTAGSNEHGRELWSTDGTPSGTRLALNLEADAQGEGPSRPAWWGDRWYMGADSSPEGGGIWTTNGLASGTSRLMLAQSFWTMDSVDQVTPIGSRVLFSISGSTSTGPFELWTTDGTEGGTVPLANLDVPRAPRGRIDGVAVGGRFLLGAFEPNRGQELWATDGTQAGTALVAELVPGWEDSEPHDFVALGPVAYFAARSPDDQGGQLWRSDGTPAGTRIVKLVSGAWGAEEIVGLGDRVYYSFYQYDGSGWALWSSDGTEAGTGPIAPANSLVGLTPHAGAIYFAAWVGGKAVPWRSDGTAEGTAPIRTDLQMYFQDSDHVPICDAPIGLLFWAIDATHGNEPWITDGTVGGTRLLRDIWPGSSASTFDPQVAALPDGTVAFTASDGLHGLEIWRTDGTEEGTTLWFDVAPGPRSSSPNHLTVSRGFLFFDADDGVTGEELWAIPLAAVGGVPDGTGGVAPLRLARGTGENLALNWESSCGNSAIDYAVYEGTLGDFSGHTPLLCTTAGATSATIAPGAGDRYYLVVPKNPVTEGSYGADGEGRERPPSLNPCSASQDFRPCS